MRSLLPIQVGGYQCSCPFGFHGASCEINFDDCFGVDCKNGGTCVDGIGNSSCTCVAGFQGQFCADDINECQVSGWEEDKLDNKSCPGHKMPEWRNLSGRGQRLLLPLPAWIRRWGVREKYQRLQRRSMQERSHLHRPRE